MLKGNVRVGSAQDTQSRTDSGAAGAGAGARLALDAFLGMLEPFLVSPPVYHQIGGAMDADIVRGIWTWIARDVAARETGALADAIESGVAPDAALARILPGLVDRLRENAAAERQDEEIERRNTLQMGGEPARRTLPFVIAALRRHELLAQAGPFGKAIGQLADEAKLAGALEMVRISNPLTRALWMQAMVGHLANPGRVMAAAVRLAGGNTEAHMAEAGFAPLVEAILSHAQSQIAAVAAQPGVFTDHDSTCRSVDRFHRLMRAISRALEIDRKSRWGKIMTDLTTRFSERLERPLKEISIHVTRALRRPRDGQDALDPEDVLMALNGLYLLATIRRSRDSLAVNALLDKAWSDTGQALEVLVTRTLDHFRANPTDPVARERLEAGIKMAEIRFNPEYADILRRARDGAERRVARAEP